MAAAANFVAAVFLGGAISYDMGKIQKEMFTC